MSPSDRFRAVWMFKGPRLTGFLTCGLLAGMFLFSSGTAEEAFSVTGHGFRPHVEVLGTSTHLIVRSNGLPDHPTGVFPNPTNPNRIIRQNYRFKIPLHPVRAERPTPTPFGPIGVALNGIPFYNQYNAEKRDAVKLEVFDSCCGHPDPGGKYHYHKYPVCVKSPFKEEPGQHSQLIGYMFDGYAIYGPNDINGKPPTDLDECNGHYDEERGYHYHATAGFPYLIGAYRGVVDTSNFMRGRPGDGAGSRRRGPPGMLPLTFGTGGVVCAPFFWSEQ